MAVEAVWSWGCFQWRLVAVQANWFQAGPFQAGLNLVPGASAVFVRCGVGFRSRGQGCSDFVDHAVDRLAAAEGEQAVAGLDHGGSGGGHQSFAILPADAHDHHAQFPQGRVGESLAHVWAVGVDIHNSQLQLQAPVVSDLDKLLDLCDNIMGRSFCALADGAASPIISSLKYFRQEYLDHLSIGACPFDPTAATLFESAGVR